MTIQSRGLGRLRDKFIPFGTYGNQNWQGGDMQWETPFYGVKRFFDHMDHMIKRRMVTKFCKVVTYYEKLLPIESQPFENMVT